MTAGTKGRRWKLVALAGAMACGDDPQAPVACPGNESSLDVFMGFPRVVTACFEDPNGDVVEYSLASNTSSVAAVSISGEKITLTPRFPGMGSFSVVGTDPGGLAGEYRVTAKVGHAVESRRTYCVIAGVVSDGVLVEADGWVEAITSVKDLVVTALVQDHIVDSVTVGRMSEGQRVDLSVSGVIPPTPPQDVDRWCGFSPTAFDLDGAYDSP